jgi:hypothetical protein
MLKKEAQQKLLKTLNIPDDQIATLMGDDELDIEDTLLTGRHIFDEDGLKTLKDNVKRGHEEAYTEIECKNLNEKYKLGLKGKDAKDREKVYAAMQAKAIADAGIAPDAKVKELSDSIEALRGNITTAETEATTWKQKYEQRLLDDEYRSLLSADRNPSLDDVEWIERLKRQYEFTEDNGIKGLIDKRTGKPVKDNKENLIPAADVISERFKSEASWRKADAPAADPADTTKKTHNPARTPGKGEKKYKNSDDIQREVDKKYPLESRVPGIKKLRLDYFNQLAAM